MVGMREDRKMEERLNDKKGERINKERNMREVIRDWKCN